MPQQTRPLHLRRLNQALFAAGLALASLAAAPAQAQTPAQSRRHVEIGAGTLDAALNRYAGATGTLLAIDGTLTNGKSSAGLNGDYTLQEGFMALLAGSGLEAVAQPGGGYALRRTVATGTTAADAVLPQVRITGTAEDARGPVFGYAAQRSATATKTDSKLAETPQAVTVVTRDQIIDQGATTIQGALGYAAGVRSDAYGLDSRSDGMRVRGTTPDDYLDGVRKTFGYFTTSARTEPYTLERIEVLLGAAAMLYGQGSTGGVVNMVSKRPQAERQNEVGVEYGSWQRKQVNGDFTGALTDDGQWLYRLVVVKRLANTQVDDTRDDRALVAPSLTWKPSAATSLTLQALYQDDKTTPTHQFLPWSGLNAANPNGAIPISRFVGEPGFDYYNIKRKTFGWQFEHVLNADWTFRQNARYSDNTVDYKSIYGDPFSLPGGYYGDPVNQRLLGRYADLALTKTQLFGADQTLEGKLRTGAVQHTLLLGFDYLHYKQTGSAASDYPDYLGGGVPSLDVYNPVYSGYTAPAMTAVAANRQIQTGFYVQDQLRLTDKWLLVAGLRHDHASNATEGSDTQKSSATTKRAGLMYVSDIGLSPYVSYSESFTPVADSAQGQRFKPLRGEQWEGGVKYQAAGGKLSVNADAYHWKENNQLLAVTPVLYQQLGRTETKGVELEARGQVAAGLDVIAHYNYIDIDKQLEAIPRNQAAVWGRQRFVLAGLPGFSAGAGVRYMSAFTDGAAPQTPSVTLLDALLAWEDAHWRVALNVNNLTNRTYVSTCLGRGDCWIGSQRNAVLSATYRW